jgi:O-antigen ligase
LKDPVFWLTAAVLAASLLFGGATRQGLVSEAIPELLSLPLLALALPRALPILKRSPSALALSAGAIALPCIQLIPLPPGLWSALPGRDIVAQILTSADAPLSWRPISLIPSQTWRAVLSLLPAVAMFLATLNLDRDARRLLLLLALAIGVASVLLAMLQVLGGADSGLYFFSFTNPKRGVGSFANANHFGAFEYILLPLGAAALAETSTRSSAFLLAVLGGIAPALLFGLALSGSRSAIILGALAAVATLGLLTPELAKLGRRRSLALFSAFAVAILPVAMGLGLLQILSRFAEQDVAEDARWRIAANTMVGIWNYFPFGAGLGTFPSAFPLHERAADAIPEFVNRAHNDGLETLFEGGAGSLLLLLGFVVWLATATYRAFVREDALQGRQARAGAIAMWLLLIHSLWDYPLRTIALETLFGFCAALQFAPPQNSHEHLSFRWPWSESRKTRRRRHRSRAGAAPPVGTVPVDRMGGRVEEAAQMEVAAEAGVEFGRERVLVHRADAASPRKNWLGFASAQGPKFFPAFPLGQCDGLVLSSDNSIAALSSGVEQSSPREVE